MPGRITPLDIIPNLPTAPALQPIEEDHEVERHGTRLVFEEDITGRVATYANGDIALLLPLTLVRKYPESKLLEGRVSNGVERNPTPANWNEGGQFMYQGFDSALRYSQSIVGNDYVPALNVAFEITEANPYVIDQPCSLVCSTSRAQPGVRPGFREQAVFTFVDELPAAGAFRPPYCTQDDKVSLYNESMIDYSVLRSLDKTLTNLAPQNLGNAGQLARFEEVTSYFERVWLDHVPEFVGRTFRGLKNCPDYGAFMAELLGEALVLLNLDYTNEQKRDLLVNVLQIGIDMEACITECYLAGTRGESSGGSGGGYPMWPIGGGHGNGRWPVILFTGYVLGIDSFKNLRTRFAQELFNELRGQSYFLNDDGEGGDGDPATTPNVWNKLFGRHNPAATTAPGGGVNYAISAGGDATNYARWGNQHGRAPSQPTGPVADPTNAQGRAQDDARLANGEPFPNGDEAIWNKHLEYFRADTLNNWWGSAGVAIVMDALNGGATGCDFMAKVKWPAFFWCCEFYDDEVLGGGPAFSYAGEEQHEALAIGLVEQERYYWRLCRQFWKVHAEGAVLPAAP